MVRSSITTLKNNDDDIAVITKENGRAVVCLRVEELTLIADYNKLCEKGVVVLLAAKRHETTKAAHDRWLHQVAEMCSKESSSIYFKESHKEGMRDKRKEVALSANDTVLAITSILNLQGVFGKIE